MRKMVRSIILGVAVAALGVPGLAHAAATNMLDFMQDIGVPDPSTNNVLFFGWSPIVPSTSPAELSQVAELNFGLAMYEQDGRLHFTFVNGETENALDSIITGIYFDDEQSVNDVGFYFQNSGWNDDPATTAVVETSLTNDLWTSPTGVEFPLFGSTLPEGNTLVPPFNVTDSLSVERQNQGGATNGIDSLPEYLTLGYDYANGYDFLQIAGLFFSPDPQIRIGMHVQGIGGEDGFSESVLWTPVYGDSPPNPGPLDPGTVVPVPAAAGLGFLGMALVGVVRRKKC